MARLKWGRVAVLVGVLLVVGGLVGFNLFRDRMIEQFFANMPQDPVTIAAAPAQVAPWVAAVEAIGTARAALGVELAVETQGLVEGILFQPNQRVEAGQVLVRLNDDIQRAELAAAQADLKLAEAQLARQRELRERGVAAQSTLEEAVARVASANAVVQRLNELLDQKIIAAPFAGVIGIPRIDTGAYVQPGTSIATLQNMDTMQVDFGVPEQAAAGLEIGQPVTLESNSGMPLLRGKVIGINPRVDPQTRLVALRAEVANPGGRLLPGEFVRVNVQLPSVGDVLQLPQTAVITSLYGSYVFRLEKDGEGVLRARQVFVEVGRRAGGWIEIRGGVQPGQVIVTAGQNKLQNGTPVTVDNSVDPTRLARPAGPDTVLDSPAGAAAPAAGAVNDPAPGQGAAAVEGTR